MLDSGWRAWAASAFERRRLMLGADAYDTLVMASLPLSTTATAILLIPWLVILLPTLDTAMIRREIMTVAGGTPLILLSLATLGTLWADVSWIERLWGVDVPPVFNSRTLAGSVQAGARTQVAYHKLTLQPA